MKNGIVTLKLFEALDQIARENKIKDGQWAMAAGMKYASRVAEMRWRSRLEATGQDPRKAGRAFSVPKLAKLLKGLQDLIGGDVLNKQLLKHVKDADSRLERVLFMVLALAQEDPDLEQLEGICETMIRASLTREKKKPKAVKLEK